MPKGYRFPASVRDLVDCDYIDKLSAADRDWMLRFLDAHYNAHAAGVGTDDHIHEADRVKKRLNRDLFVRGRPVSEAALAFIASPPIDADCDMQRPEVLVILEELRTLRPGFDDTDGRRRATFASADAKRRFYKLRAELAALLEVEE